MSAKWSAEDDEALALCIQDGLTASQTGQQIDRSEAACYARSGKLGLNFASSEASSLRNFLADGGHLIREDIGGAIGIRWSRAHRSASAFSREICERLLARGEIKHDPKTNTFRGSVV